MVERTDAGSKGPAPDDLVVTERTLVTTLAGSGTAAFSDGTGGSASFNLPLGVAVDASGNVYVGDYLNERVRLVTAEGEVTTFAGSGSNAFADGSGTSASFHSPAGVALDAAANLYVVDQHNNRIRKVSPALTVTTVAGSGANRFADGTGGAASFNYPFGVAADAAGNLYVADTSNHRIRKVTLAGEVTSLAGSGKATFADGTGDAASFHLPKATAVDAAGNVYVADQWNHRIRKVTPSGVVTTLAGSGRNAFADGTGQAASFNYPHGVALDLAGNLYVADAGNQRIRKVTPAGAVTTLAGSGHVGSADGAGTEATFHDPTSVAVDAMGNVYVADTNNHRIRKVAPVDANSTAASAPSASTKPTSN
jgi:sugar lactone lactonase YvrE